jgi:hypothetical protein
VSKRKPRPTAFSKRLGRCYELSAKYVFDHEGCVLVHGSIQGFGRPRIDHAWVVLPDGDVHDPVADTTWSAELHRQIFNAVETKRYAKIEAVVCMVRDEHYGPWEQDEQQQDQARR